jgi:hypothetical protein
MSKSFHFWGGGEKGGKRKERKKNFAADGSL